MPGKTSLGSGDPDETLSHWWAHLAHEGTGWATTLNNILDRIDPGHAPEALIADAEGFNTPTKMSERAGKGVRIIISGIR